MKLIRLFRDLLSSQPEKTVVPESTGLSRRQFAGAALGLASLPGAASGAGLDLSALAGLPRAQLALIVRNLAMLEPGADPILMQDCQHMISDIATVLPEAPKLLELHRLYPPVRRYNANHGGVSSQLASLHDACIYSRPISFDYTDQKGQQTSRRVLPIEIIHPATGIQLLGWCEKRQAHRKFFISEIRNLKILSGDFSTRRSELIQGAIDEKEAWMSF